MKNRKFIIPLLFLAVSAGFTSCEDSRNEYLEDYQCMVYFRNGGEQEVTLFRVGEDTFYEIPICKGGRDLEAIATATVAPMSQAQMDIYNIDNGASYTQLSDEYWDFVEVDNEESILDSPVTVNFAADDRYQTIKIRLHTNEISAVQEANPDNDYILGLQVYADPKVSPDINIILIRPAVDIPMLYFNNAAMESYYYTSESPDVNEYTNDVILGLDNRWDFTVNLAVEDQTWLDEYNTVHETSYELLPEGAYSFTSADGTVSYETLSFEVGTSREPMAVTVRRNEMRLLTEYLLPVVISDWSKEELSVDENGGHWLLSFRLDPDQVTLTEGMLSSPYTHSTDGAGLSALVSDPASNWWHTIYGGAADPACDEVYGQFIDIRLSEPLTDIVFSYQTRTTNSNGVPSLIVVGVTNDASGLDTVSQSTDVWTEIGRVDTGLATGAGEWCTLPAFHSDTPFSYVRFGIATSALGSNTQGNAGTALSELQLYGANMAQ